jgi:iron complex outermembrane receptor protein
MGGATLNLFTSLGHLGELTWTLNAYAQSKQHNDDRDVVLDQKSYALYNASVSWKEIAGSKFDFRLWGRNLTDEKYMVGGVGILDVAGLSSALWGTPRTYGVDLTYRFGE